MERLLLLTMAILLINGVVVAQPDLGSLDVFSDPGYTSCDFVDTGGLISVYVLSTHSGDGSTAVQFRMNIPSAWTLLGNTSPFPVVVGDPIGGISIGYGQCIVGDNLIMSANFLGDGLSPACSFITILPDPAAPTGNIEIVDCQSPFPAKWEFAQLGQGIVNGDGSCDCTYLPVHETTWGGIKALYE
jgi:hypothetical protein